MHGVIALACVAGLAALGCATPAPLRPAALTTAEAAIAAAAEAGAAALAAEPLSLAREKLALADESVAKGMPTRASRLAEPARVDALLSRALSEKARADRQLAETRRLDAKLRREAESALEP